MSKFKTCKSEQEDPLAIGPSPKNVHKGTGKQSFPLNPVINFNRSAVSLKLYMENLSKHYDDKINMQGLTSNFLYTSRKTYYLQCGATFGPHGHNLNKYLEEITK